MSGSLNVTNISHAAASSYRGTEDERVLRASIRRLDGSDELAEVPRRTVLASRLEGAALPRFLPPRAAHADERSRALSADDGPLLLEGEEAAERAAANVALVAVAAAGLDFGEFTRLVKDIVAHQEARTAEALATAEVAAAAFARFDADRSGGIDPQELSAALSAMGVPGDAASVRQAIAAYGEGHRALNVAEFTTLARGVIAAQKTEAALAGLTAASYRAAFDRFDADTSGTIEAKELQPALAALMPGRTFGLDEVVKIMSTYETVRRAAGAGAAAKAEAAAEAAAAAAGLDLPAFTALVRDVIAFEEAKKAEALATPAKINAAFDRVDRDKSGTIDARELAAALGAMGVPGDAGHVRAAIRRYGGGARANLGRAEFARLTRELLAHQQTEAALAKIPTAAYKQAFDRFDTDKSGTIEEGELGRALAVLMPGRPNDERETAKILAKYRQRVGAPAPAAAAATAAVPTPVAAGASAAAAAPAPSPCRRITDSSQITPGRAAGRRPNFPAPAAGATTAVVPRAAAATAGIDVAVPAIAYKAAADVARADEGRPPLSWDDGEPINDEWAQHSGVVTYLAPQLRERMRQTTGAKAAAAAAAGAARLSTDDGGVDDVFDWEECGTEPLPPRIALHAPRVVWKDGGLEVAAATDRYVVRSTTWAQPAEPPPLLAAVPAGRVRFGPAGWDPAALQQPPSWVELEPERGVLASL